MLLSTQSTSEVDDDDDSDDDDIAVRLVARIRAADLLSTEDHRDS